MSHVDMTYTTGCRDKKVFAMNLLGALGTAYRVMWGISRFVGTLRWNILLVGTWHPNHRHQGPKNVGNLHLGPLGNLTTG